MSAPWPGRLAGSIAPELAGLEEQPPARGFLPWLPESERGQRQAPIDLFLGRAANHVVEEAADLAHVARGFGEAFLVGVELLEHHHRQIDVVLLETEDRGRVVHQHVGVEHEQAPHGARPRRAGDCRCRPAAGPGSDRLRRFKYFLRVPGTFTLRHSRRSTPAASIRKVLRSIAQVLAAVHALLLDHIEELADLLVLVGQQREGQLFAAP